MNKKQSYWLVNSSSQGRSLGVFLGLSSGLTKKFECIVLLLLRLYFYTRNVSIDNHTCNKLIFLYNIRFLNILCWFNHITMNLTSNMFSWQHKVEGHGILDGS